MNPFDPSAEHAAIREGVAQVCAHFPGAYWRDLDARRAYPETFVAALIAGRLSRGDDPGRVRRLRPQPVGGAAILEEIHRSGCNAAACHAQMYTMGTVLRHGIGEQKRHICRASPTARCACRRSASPSRPAAPIRWRCAPPPTRDGDGYIVNGQKIWTSRAEHSDLMVLLARTTPREMDEKRTEGFSVFLST